jgi:hypothetical protein
MIPPTVIIPVRPMDISLITALTMDTGLIGITDITPGTIGKAENTDGIAAGTMDIGTGKNSGRYDSGLTMIAGGLRSDSAAYAEAPDCVDVQG